MPVQHGVLDDPSTGTTWFWSCNYKLPDPDPVANAKPYGHAKGWDDPKALSSAAAANQLNYFPTHETNPVEVWNCLMRYMLRNNSNSELPKC